MLSKREYTNLQNQIIINMELENKIDELSKTKQKKLLNRKPMEQIAAVGDGKCVIPIFISHFDYELGKKIKEFNKKMSRDYESNILYIPVRELNRLSKSLGLDKQINSWEEVINRLKFFIDFNVSNSELEVLNHERISYLVKEFFKHMPFIRISVPDFYFRDLDGGFDPMENDFYSYLRQNFETDLSDFITEHVIEKYKIELKFN